MSCNNYRCAQDSIPSLVACNTKWEKAYQCTWMSCECLEAWQLNHVKVCEATLTKCMNVTHVCVGFITECLSAGWLAFTCIAWHCTWSPKACNYYIICSLSTYKKVCKWHQASFLILWVGAGDEPMMTQTQREEDLVASNPGFPFRILSRLWFFSKAARQNPEWKA